MSTNNTRNLCLYACFTGSYKQKCHQIHWSPAAREMGPGNGDKRYLVKKLIQINQSLRSYTDQRQHAMI